MKPKSTLRNFLALASSAVLAAPLVNAANIYWDGGTVNLGGGGGGTSGGTSGNWNTTLTNWDSGPGAHVAWPDLSTDTAVFGGTAGTVTLTSSITAGQLRFDTTGYTLTTGANTLSFDAANNNILFNNATAAANITGTVAGTGNVSLSNVAGTNTAGTLTFNGTSATGWSGTTTIGAGMTLASVSTAALTNKVLSSTTGGITLNGGTIQFTRASNSDIDAINNSAIGVNGGGTFSVTSSGGGASASETIGTVTVNSGQMNFVQTANNQNILVLGGLNRGASTTSAVNFSSAALGTAKIVVTGAGGATAANEIYAPWATVGITANTQTDYAVFNASNEVGARGIGATAQSTWSTALAATSNYTLTNAAGSAADGKLSLTRIVNTVRNTTASSSATATNVGVGTSDYFTLAGHTFANGDVVSASGTGGLLNGGDTYYVINSGVGGATRFQLSSTSGGTAVDFSNTTAGTIAGGITLSTGNNLETYGILNGSTAALAIGASGTGALTTPAGGGSLYLTTGAGGIFINAPITNSSDSAAVTVVKNGTGGKLLLTGNNTFTGGLVVNGGIAGSSVYLSGTQSFTGGITLNGGGIGENSANSTPFTQAAALNGNAITVNGPSHLVVEGTLPSTSTITINPNAVLKLGAGNSTLTVQGVVSGSGVLDINANNFNANYSVSLTNTANTFTGDVTYNASNGSNTLSVASIGDAGKVVVGMYANSAVKTFELNSAASSALTFNTRQFELAGPSGGHNLAIDNNSAQAFTINTDLLATGVGTRTLTLQGAGAGLSIFNGVLGNGSLTSLGITKAETGTWALTKANTYTGATTITGGKLQIGNGSTTGSLSTSSAITITSPGTLAFNRSNAVVQGTDFSGAAITGTGSLLQAGSDTLTLNVANTFTGTTTVTAGRILMTHASALQYSAYNTIGSNGSTIGLDVTNGLSSNTLTLGGLSGSVNLASAITAGYTGTVTNLTLNPQSGTSYTYTGAIANATTGMTVTKNNAGTQLLHGNNSYTGGTILNAGTIEINNANSFGTGTITFAGTATIQPTHSSSPTLANGIQVNPGAVGTLYVDNQFFNMTFTGPVTGSGTLIQLNGAGGATGSVTLSSAANTFTGILQLAAPNGKTSSLTVNSLADSANPIRFTSSTATALGNNFILGAGTATPLLFNSRQIELASATGTAGIYNNNGTATNTITINTNLLITANGAKTLLLGGSNIGANTFAGTIGNSGAGATAITKADGGLWILSNTASTYTGVTTVNGGNLQVSTLNNGGSGNNSSIGASTAVAGNLVLNGGTLRYTGAAVSTDRLFSVGSSSGTLNSSGTGAINFTNTGSMGFNAQTGARTLTLTGANTGNNTLAAVIGDNTGATAVTKNGIGTWVLSGANTNTGAATVNGGGTLVLDYSTANNAKIAAAGALNLGTATLTSLGGGTIDLSGGSFAQSVGSTALNPGGTFITRSSGTSTLNLNAITPGGAGNRGGSLSFSANGIATTDRTNTNGILGGYFTVGSDWAVNSTNGADGSIIALTTYTPMVASGAVNTTNYSLTGSLTLTTAASTVNSLKIIASADGQTLGINSRDLTPTTIGNASGVLFTAGGNGYTYNITGTTGVIKAATPNNDIFFHVIDGTLNVTALVSAGTGLVVKAGDGTLVLGATNTYNAITYVNEGVLRLTNAAGAGAITSAIGVQNLAALELANSVAIGNKALTITGTGVSNAGALRNVASNTSSYAGAITIGTGGARINSDANGALTLSNGVVTSQFNDVTFGGAGNTTVQTVAISGAGGLIKDGAGTTTLTATNTYTGATTVSDGKLVVNGSISTSLLTTVQTGATLGGNGTIGALTIDSGGYFAPGNSPGIETVNGNYIQNGTLQMEIEGGTAGNGTGFHDQVVVNGSVTLNGLLDLVTFSGTYAENNMIFLLLNDGSDAIFGGFTSLAQGDVASTYGGFEWKISYTGNSGGSPSFTGGNDVVLMATIPEPGAALIGSLGLLALLRRRRN